MFTLGSDIKWPAVNGLENLRDGQYTFGIRPHHVTSIALGDTPVQVDGSVKITEISGSESVIHFNMRGNSWVSQTKGIKGYEVGSIAHLYADVSQGLYFDNNDKRISI